MKVKRNISNRKEYNNIKNICTISVMIILFFVTAKILRFLLIDDTESYTRITMHQLYNSPQNIDELFLGSSHVFRSIVPSIMDEKVGCYTFNAGSAEQKMDASYFLLKEVAKNNRIDRVYLELYFIVAENNTKKDREKMTSTYIISDYAKPSINKFDFLIHASSKEHYINSFILARRNWEKLFDLEYIKELTTEKMKKEYWTYSWVNKKESGGYYVDRGFVANDKITKGLSEWPQRIYNPIDVSRLNDADNEWRNDIMKIISFCEENDIELIFYMAPIPTDTLRARGNYSEYHNIIQAIADEAEVPFYDFCLVKKQYFDTSNMNMYEDEGHLNTNGANCFSELFGDFISGKYKYEDMIYDSFEEKEALEK